MDRLSSGWLAVGLAAALLMGCKPSHGSSTAAAGAESALRCACAEALPIAARAAYPRTSVEPRAPCAYLPSAMEASGARLTLTVTRASPSALAFDERTRQAVARDVRTVWSARGELAGGGAWFDAVVATRDGRERVTVAALLDRSVVVEARERPWSGEPPSTLPDWLGALRIAEYCAAPDSDM